MSTPRLGLLVAAVTYFSIGMAHAQNEPVWRVHNTLEADRPLLCKDASSVNLVVSILSRALEARSEKEIEKSDRLADIAGRLQAEICRRPAADDIVILRCKLAQDSTGRISTVKLSAVIRSEASKGEQPVYAWTYAKIDSGSADTEAQDATAKWCASEKGSDEILSPTPDLVLRVQQRLYDFGLQIPQINGQLTAETVQGLIEFQKFAKLPPTGQLTKQTVDKIVSMAAPSAWVSVAFNGAGNFGVEIGATRRGAEIEAVKKLQRRSRGDYKLSSTSAPNCIAFATTGYTERDRRRRTTFTQAFTSVGNSAAAATQAVLNYCENEKGGGTCEVRQAVCADGSGRYDRDAIPANSPAPQNQNPAPRFDPKNIPLNSAPPRG